jgi:nicotinamidase/pyrazinamidase
MPTIEQILIDVDTQVDFMEPGGRLYVPRAEELLGPLERLFLYARRTRTPVLSSVDEHVPDDPEFRDWPPHCVRGTPGQQKIPITLMAGAVTLRPEAPPFDSATFVLTARGQIIFPKPTLDAFDNPHFRSLIDNLDAGQYVVFGVATEYCVRLAARGLLQRGRRVKIVQDAVRAITPEAEARTREELTSLGAEWVTTAEIVSAA